MKKEEVLGILNDMLEKTLNSTGFIAGFVTQGFVVHMIEKKIEEVEALEEDDGSG